MKRKLKLRRSKDRTFSISLAEARLKLGILHSILILLALGFNSNKIDYSIAGAYLVFNLFLWLPFLKYFVTHSFRFILFGIDLIVSGYMIAETGGSNSPLYPFLFIPIILAVLRCKYIGIIGWCSFISAVLIGADGYSKTFQLIPLTLKVLYLYLAGIVGGYLMHRTFSVKEEIYKTITRWNIDLQRLNSFSQEVTGSSDLNEIFTRILKTVRQSNPAQMAAIMIFDEDQLKIYDHIGWDESWVGSYNQHPLSKHSLTLAPIIVFKQPLLCTDIKKHPELTKIFQDIPVESLFAYPLVITGEVVGALVVTGSTTQILTEQETQILISISNQASMAIQNVVNLSHEKQKADTDGLTGLYNRRYFNEQIDWLTTTAQQNETPLSLIMFDVDNFKKYNDTYGHPAGDQLLKIISATISDVVREHDIFARYGGEEFAIILRDTNNRLARHIAERIRLAVENLPPGQLKSPITISVGVGTYPDNAKDKNSLLEFTDKSLYHAKHSGKNRVCCGYK